MSETNNNLTSDFERLAQRYAELRRQSVRMADELRQITGRIERYLNSSSQQSYADFIKAHNLSLSHRRQPMESK